MVLADNLIRQDRQWLPVDFHNQAMRFEMGKHPFEWNNSLKVKLSVRILVEDDFGQQRVDINRSTLSGEWETRFRRVGNFVRMVLVFFPLPCRVHIYLKTFIRIRLGGNVNLVSIH